MDLQEKSRGEAWESSNIEEEARERESSGHIWKENG
jgi:hypothetical protein